MARLVLALMAVVLLAVSVHAASVWPGAAVIPGQNFSQHIGEFWNNGVPPEGSPGWYSISGGGRTFNCRYLGLETTTCDLPFEVVPGDVVMVETGVFNPGDEENSLPSHSSYWSDVIRFTGRTATLYSDTDTDFNYLGHLSANFIWMSETTPPPTWWLSGGNTYFIYSDSPHPDIDVPEPATLLLMGAGLALLARKLRP